MNNNSTIRGLYESKGRLYIRVSHDGVRKQVPFTNEWLRQKGLEGAQDDATRAERIRNKLLQQISEAQLDGLTSRRKWTVREAIDHFLVDKEKQPKATRPQKKQRDRLKATLLTGTKRRPALVNHLKPRRKVSSVKPGDLANFQRKNEDLDLKPNSVHAYMSDCRTFFTWCVEKGVIARSPIGQTGHSVPPMEGLEEGCTPYSSYEMDAILKSLPARKPLQRMWMVARHTGARRSELLRIRFKDIDWRRGLLLIHGAPKNKEKQVKPRLVTLLPELRKFLFAIRTEGEAYVSSLTTEKWSVNAYRNAARRFNRKFDLDLSSQRMRRTVAQLMAENGTPIEAVAGFLGNSVETLRKWYVQPFPPLLNDATLAALEGGANPDQSHFQAPLRLGLGSC